jgi:probable rRNA maturation factor
LVNNHKIGKKELRTMAISVRRLKTPIPYNSALLKSDAKKILHALNYVDFALTILLTNNTVIQSYNREYRGIDKPTDILSFSFHDYLKPGEPIEACCNDEKNIGDLVISLEYVQNDAEKWGESFEQRIQTLLVHGICHLLGYDHETEEEYNIMHREEMRLLKVLGR